MALNTLNNSSEVTIYTFISPFFVSTSWFLVDWFLSKQENKNKKQDATYRENPLSPDLLWKDRKGLLVCHWHIFKKMNYGLHYISKGVY